MLGSGDEPPSSHAVLLGIVAGVGNIWGLAAFYKAATMSSISVVSAIGAGLGTSMPVVFGLATGETLTTLQAAGILVAMGGGVLAAAIAWAALVYAGIRIGQSARDGDGTAWVFMAIASLGAVPCLFLALMLGARVARMLGFTSRTPVRSVVAKGKRSAGKRAAPRH